MAQQSASGDTPLYPLLESTTAPLNQDERYKEIIALEKELTTHFNKVASGYDVLNELDDKSVMPDELLTETRRVIKQKVDPVKALIEASTEEVEDEEEADDEEDEDEEVADDEEDDAGGDYLISHFDNGEGYEDNDDEGEDNTSMI